MRDPYARRRRPLARLSQGRPARAALILLAVYLPAALLGWAGWLVGLAPVFAQARGAAIAMTGAVGLATVGALVFVFGSWPMPTPAGLSRGYGERYDSFGSPAGFRLGLLRTVLQLVVTTSCVAALLFTVLDVRWFTLVPTERMRSLPALADAMPVPPDWRLTRSAEGVDDVKVPNAYAERSYDVAGTTVDLRAWLSAPAWAHPPQGPAFGAIRIERCRSATSCLAHLVPAPGDPPEVFVRADLYGAGSQEAQVQIRVSYREHVEPTRGASDVIVERVAQMPIPPDWVRYEVSGEGPSGATRERYVQSFGVPVSFGPAELDAWLASAAWTEPTSGPAFGAVVLDEPCRRERLTGSYRCDLTVAATAGQPVVESLELRLATDHTVQITLVRDW